MYTFRPYTERIWKYRERIRNRIIQADSERLEIKVDAWKKYKDVVPLIRVPLTTKEIVSRMTISVEDDELIVGSKAKNFCGASGAHWALMVSPENGWEKREDGLWYNDPVIDGVPLCISQEALDKTRELAPMMFEMSSSKVGDAWLPEGARDFFDLGTNDYGFEGRAGVMMLPTGHLTPGWQKIVGVGYGAIRKEAQAWVDARRGKTMGDDMRKLVFYQAAIYECVAKLTDSESTDAQ
jgi:formate C-acetyltransferase